MGQTGQHNYTSNNVTFLTSFAAEDALTVSITSCSMCQGDTQPTVSVSSTSLVAVSCRALRRHAGDKGLVDATS